MSPWARSVAECVRVQSPERPGLQAVVVTSGAPEKRGQVGLRALQGKGCLPTRQGEGLITVEEVMDRGRVT